MKTKWAFTEPRNFDDIASTIVRSKVPFELLTRRSTRRPMTCGLTLYLSSGEATLLRDFLVKALHADNWQLGATFEQLVQLLAEYYPLACPEHVMRIEPATKSAFEEGKAYYERNKESLTRRFEGQYIAIWENDVLDSDASFSSLAQRVYEKIGYVSIYMPFVTSKRRVLRFESPERRWSKANAP